ncbi:uncharacterized protein GLRG_00857 [Colletotrichum graminicola M1.001]|uniref:Transcription factor domain-containing protein n=1 Tax=Colletotrichum graminicola (strain M1.001 / M2 / FGSC 10212) TaxID=645133 RepID=E3Q3W1_COLGM|nr:uncharacterized protein GLRG_00857 [Colletotrichum graminicola M1.001]EFQ25713.1 hypothetical protein GLRG_00857 [Colletotrichum graminicola M1.001]
MRHSPWSVARLSVSQSRHSRIPNFRFRRKTSQLEERLDRLVNLLRVSDGTSALASHAETAQINTCTEPTPLVPNNTYSALPPNHPGPDLHAQNDVSSRRAIELADVCPVKIPVSYNAFVPPTCICRPEPGEAPPPPDTDENLLKVYRTVMAPQFPFVLVPEGVSAATLGATRPFLMAAIRMVSSFRSMRSMRGQMYRLLNYIADYMVLRAERSFDLLLGLVVVVAWFHHHCVAHAQLHQLISLAACLVGELGLKNSPCLPERTRLLVLRPWEMRERTNEERRVLLAVWYLSSSIALDIHAFDPLRYSRYMQQCTRELQETQEYDSDMQLICIVRIQRLCERVADLRSRDYDDEEADMVVRAPFSAHMMGFSAELNKLQAEMPPGLLHLKIRTATARLRIHEPPNIDAELLASLSKSLGSAGSGSTNALDAFYQSNAALKAWFDTWLSVPAESFCGMALPMVSHMVYGVMMLSRWAWLASRENVPSTLLQAEPVDPFRNHSNIALAAMEAAINPNARTSPASPSAAPKGSSPWQTTLPDDDLPRALAALKAQLATQPGLMLDVNGYLDRVVAQLQAVDAAYREMSVDDGEWRDNIWSLGATKVKIAQLRQARWSKMVAAQAEVGELKDRRGGGNHEGVVGQGEMQEDFLASLQMPDWDANMVWDLLGYHDRMPGDEQLWEDVSPGEQNWSSVAMGGMGGFGQLGGDMNRWM